MEIHRNGQVASSSRYRKLRQRTTDVGTDLPMAEHEAAAAAVTADNTQDPILENHMAL